MKTTVENVIHGEEPAKTLIERGIVSAANISLREISLNCAFTVGTAVVSNIELVDPAGFQRNLYGQYVKCRNPY